jgi:hypothetical protein
MEMRETSIAAFLDAAGWSGAARIPLAGDASFRRYERLSRDAGTAILMDAPPPREDIRPFAAIDRHLRALGFSAPKILAEDAEAGLLLLEDFGDGTFTRLLAKGEEEAALYRLATDVLIDLHGRDPGSAIPKDVPPYDDALFVAEAALLSDWYLPAVNGAPLPLASGREYEDLWRHATGKARDVPETLVLRDFHVDNLIRLAMRPGVAACGLLDFQDAVRGPVTYDLVSLIEDARRDVSPGVAADIRSYYLAAFPDIDREAFDRSMAILGAQRHAKVIGIFTRLCVRDNKPIYLDHIPRLWRLLEADLRHPALGALRVWFDIHVPAGIRIIPTLPS